MISKENKLFLKEMFNIDCDNYSEETLDLILDEIIKNLNKTIIQKEKNILEIMKEIINSNA